MKSKSLTIYLMSIFIIICPYLSTLVWNTDSYIFVFKKIRFRNSILKLISFVKKNKNIILKGKTNKFQNSRLDYRWYNYVGVNNGGKLLGTQLNIRQEARAVIQLALSYIVLFLAGFYFASKELYYYAFYFLIY